MGSVWRSLDEIEVKTTAELIRRIVKGGLGFSPTAFPLSS